MPVKNIVPTSRVENDLLVADLDGVRVSFYRYAESGQVFVSINTEDAKFDNSDNGDPLIFVELNDAVLYDGDPDNR